MKNYLFPILFATFVLGCGQQLNKEVINHSDIIIFQQLSIAEIGLDFPRSLSQLQTCRSVKDVPCLNSYNLFCEAKGKLLRMSKHDSLELTLRRLGDACMVKSPANLKYVCEGALVALYFFSEEGDEKRISQFLSQLPQTSREKVFSRSVSMTISWLDSRTDKKAWRTWLELELINVTIIANVNSRFESTSPQSRDVYKVIENTNGS